MKKIKRHFAKTVKLSPANWEMTVWQALCWAYGPQRGGEFERRCLDERLGFGSLSATGRCCEVLALGCRVDGLAGRRMPVIDNDALEIVKAVGRLDKPAARLLAACGEAARVPAWRLELEPARLVPVLRGNGRPKMIYKNHRPIACRVRMTGLPLSEIERQQRRARNNYLMFYDGLQKLRAEIGNAHLVRLRMTGLGGKPLQVLVAGDDFHRQERLAA